MSVDDVGVVISKNANEHKYGSEYLIIAILLLYYISNIFRSMGNIF